MKKLILLSAFLLTYSLSYSQYRGGIEVGGNIMSANFSLGGAVDTESSWGIRLGYVGEYYLSEPLYLRFAVLINQRGFQLADERWGVNVIDVPLNIGYALKLNDNLKLTVDGGFNMEYNFRAFTKLDGELVTLSIGSEEEDIKPIGTGANVGIGVQLSEKLKVRGSYYNGLTNLVRTTDDTWKNRVFGLAVEFFFSK